MRLADTAIALALSVCSNWVQNLSLTRSFNNQFLRMFYNYSQLIIIVKSLKTCKLDPNSNLCFVGSIKLSFV